jgi:hypothetical protein
LQPHGRFEWIIWDVNLAFSARGPGADLDILYNGSDQPLMTRMLHNEHYRAQYLEYMHMFLESDFSDETLFPKIERLFAMIREPYLADSLKMYTNEQVLKSLDQQTADVPGLKPFIAQRREYVLHNLESISTGLIPANTIDAQLPDQVTLLPNYPNPFNGGTVIEYQLPGRQNVELTVYDMLGQKIQTLVNERQEAGRYRVRFDASAENLASGLYIYILRAGEFSIYSKMLFVK